MRTAVLHVITQIVANVLKSKDGEPLKDSGTYSAYNAN
jgi:hypothetical protein